jgi:hypothetical protein
MLVSEVFINATKGHRFGESEPYEPYTDNIGELFRAMQKEYGRCTSAVYVETPAGPPQRVGWVFEKRMRYEDARGNDRERDYYTREVWVTLYDRFERKTERDYHAL